MYRQDGPLEVGGELPSGGLDSLQLDSSKNLKVNVVAGGGGGGAVTIADGADVVEGALADPAVTTDSNGTLSGKLRGLIKLATTAGSWFVTSRTQDGTGNAIGSTSNALDVNIKSGNPTTISATQGTSPWVVGQSTGTNLHTVVDSGTITTVSTVTSVTNQVDTNLKQVGGTNTVTGGVNGTLAVGGNVATNVAIGTNPVNLGAQGVSSENSAVTTSRMVQLVADLVGKLIVLPYANPENFVSGTITSAMTGTTSTSLIASPGGSLRNYITQITVSNASTTVPTDILIQDGSGGTTLYVIPAPAGVGTGTGASGASITFPVPLRQPTVATAIYVANVTTGSSTKVSATGYKGL